MTLVAKIGILGVLGVLLAIQFKAQKPEYATYIGLAVSILIFAFCVGQVRNVMDKILMLQTYLGTGGGYLGVLLKVIGITYICEFSAGICKDAGYGAIADQIEILGKLSVIFAGFPILLAVVDQLHSFL